MSSIRKSLLQLTFSGAYLLRWNDKLRPAELVEIDKQAHKMLVACVLWHENSRHLSLEERLELGQEIIEGGLFDYYYRLIITDIKPPVFYRIKENKEHYRQLTGHVMKRLEPVLSPLGDFWQRLQAWHASDEDSLARRILRAAHLYASQWEFRLIRPLNGFDEEMEDIDASFRQRLNSFGDVKGMPDIVAGNTALARFANICGQLRFQIRWTQAPRIPATSVLGHMFIVATYAYFFSQSVGACRARAINNFFCGLLHDLPELLTRDIISPVKQSVESLPEIIREYEEQELERRIFAPLRQDGLEELVELLSYYLGMETGSEFDETIRENGHARKVADFDVLHGSCNADALQPKDGRLIKECDRLAAFMEAHSSIRNGVSSPHLQEALARLRTDIGRSPLTCLHLGALLADFD